METVYLLIISLFGISSIAAANNAGIRTVITTKGLNYFNKVGIPILQQQLQDIQIPDISGTSSVDIIGDIDYTISNIELGSLQITSSDLSSSASSGITLSISGISISGSADWKYSNHGFIHISDSGSADLSVSGASISASIIVEKGTSGHAALSASGCSFTVSSVSIEFHGGASWLYNLFDDTIEDTIKDQMQDKVCSAAISAINTNGNAMVESLPVAVPVDEFAEISYALLSNPVFTDSYIETEHKGEFLSIANPVEQSNPNSLPKITSSDKMMYVWLSEYVGNSAGQVYQDSGIIQYAITPDMIPKGVPFKLDTASLSSVVPELYKRFGNLDIEVMVKSRKPPTMKVVPKSIDFAFKGSADINLVQKNQTRTNAFTLGIDVNGDVKAWINSKNASQQILSANFTMLSANLSLINSAIGDFSLKLLQNTANLLVNIIGMPLINAKANQGLPLPVIEGVSLTNSQITLGDGYVMIGSDVSYSTGPLLKRVRRMKQRRI